MRKCFKNAFFLIIVAISISNEQISVRGNSNILVLLDGVPTTATSWQISPLDYHTINR